jgi:hypothetical protein
MLEPRVRLLDLLTGLVASLCAVACGGSGEHAQLKVAQPCSAAAGSAIDVASEPDWRRYGDYLPWADVDGCLVRIDVLAERAGPEHCGFQDTRVLITGQPLGAHYTTQADTSEYVRDPGGIYKIPALVSGFDANATLPSGARDTGFRQDERELWLDPADASAAYLKRGDNVERWPLGKVPVCK